MIKALFWENQGSEKTVKCLLCPRLCIIPEGKRGNCGARENINGMLYSIVYGKACAAAVDPVEKKPLFHFLPGSSAFSIGTAGCNLHCKFCQNWETSQAKPEDVFSEDLPPAEVVRLAKSSGCRSIAYTYNEPVVFYEYAVDTAKLAAKQGIKNISVSNGFINIEPLDKFCKYLSAANIDLKAFDDKFYRKITGAWLEPVLESIKELNRKKVWLELTNLIIPGFNDKPEMIKKMCRWIVDNLGNDVPVHFSAFYPCYMMHGTPATPPETVSRARKIATEEGIRYSYSGNIGAGDESNTFCPFCGELLIKRNGFAVAENRILKGKCSCGKKIPGIWE